MPRRFPARFFSGTKVSDWTSGSFGGGTVAFAATGGTTTTYSGYEARTFLTTRSPVRMATTPRMVATCSPESERKAARLLEKSSASVFCGVPMSLSCPCVGVSFAGA